MEETKATARAIADRLEQEVYDALHRQYCTNPDPLILKRLRQELTAMQERECVLDVAALYETTQWLKKRGHPYWMSGFAGSGFLLYLLGITSTNPLPPHLHCPKCHRIIWKGEYKDGFDIPPTICEHDGTPMIADGHNIPWQSFWGYGDYKPEFIVYLCADTKDDVAAWLKGHWLQKFVADSNEKAVPYILSRLRFGFGFHAESTFYPAQIDASCKDAVIRHVRERMIWQGEILETGLSFPDSFADAVATLGIFDEMGRNDVLQKLVRSGIPASDLIVFREDVFSCLQKHGFVEKAAWQGMVQAWEGSGLPDTDNGILDQYKENMHRYSKADVMELLFFNLRTEMTSSIKAERKIC